MTAQLEESNNVDEIKIKKLFIDKEICGVTQKIIMILGTDGNMYKKTTGNLFNEVGSIKEVISIIKNNKNIKANELELNLVTFKGSPIKQKDIDELIKLGVKDKNIKLFSGGVGIKNFNIDNIDKVKNIPYYSRKNTVNSIIKSVEEFIGNIDKEDSIIIGRGEIGKVISGKYGGVKQISSNNKGELLKEIEGKKNIIITTGVTKSNKGFLDKELLDKLPKGANIINASRKELVKEEDLKQANIKYISDVYEGENEQNPKNFDNAVFINEGKIIKRKNGKDIEISKKEFDILKEKGKILFFLTPHIYGREGYKDKEPGRKFYEYRKILGIKNRYSKTILEKINKDEQNGNNKSFIDMMTK